MASSYGSMDVRATVQDRATTVQNRASNQDRFIGQARTTVHSREIVPARDIVPARSADQAGETVPSSDSVPDSSQRPSNNGHYHVIACVFIVVAPVSLYSLLNVFPLINNPPSNKADVIKAMHITAAVIYGASCTVIVFFMAKYIHVNRAGRMHAEGNELDELQPHVTGTSRGSTRVRDVVLTILFLGSLIQIVFTVLTNDLDTTSAVLVAFTVLFCILQLPLVLSFTRRRSDSRFNVYLLAVVTAGNACICVEFVIFSLLQQHSHAHKGKIQKLSEKVVSVLYVCRVHYAVFTTFLLFTKTVSGSGEALGSVNLLQNEVRNIEPVEDGTSTSVQDSWWWRKTKHYLATTVRFISRHSLYFSLIYCAVLISVNIADKAVPHKGGRHNSSSHGNHSNLVTMSVTKQIHTVYDTVETICAYAASVVDFVVLIFAGLELSVARIKLADKVLLLVSVSSFIIIHMIEIVIDASYLCNLPQSAPLSDVANFVSFVLFTMLELYCQTALILKASSLRPVSPLSLNQMFVRGTVVFLCVFNFEKWIHDSFLFSKDYSLFRDNEGAVKAWYGLALPFYAIESFYRLFSAILCYETLLSYPRE